MTERSGNKIGASQRAEDGRGIRGCMNMKKFI